MSEINISLSDLVAELRNELALAQEKGKGLEPRLVVEEAEIELQVEIKEDSESQFGVKFWVFNAGLKDRESDGVIQKMKLKLKPTTKSGEDYNIRRERKR